MENKSKLKVDNSTLIRLSNKTVKIARKNKKKTGQPIGRFIEDAILLSELVNSGKIITVTAGNNTTDTESKSITQ